MKARRTSHPRGTDMIIPPADFNEYLFKESTTLDKFVNKTAFLGKSAHIHDLLKRVIANLNCTFELVAYI